MSTPFLTIFSAHGINTTLDLLELSYKELQSLGTELKSSGANITCNTKKNTLKQALSTLWEQSHPPDTAPPIPETTFPQPPLWARQVKPHRITRIHRNLCKILGDRSLFSAAGILLGVSLHLLY